MNNNARSYKIFVTFLFAMLSFGHSQSVDGDFIDINYFNTPIIQNYSPDIVKNIMLNNKNGEIKKLAPYFTKSIDLNNLSNTTRLYFALNMYEFTLRNTLPTSYTGMENYLMPLIMNDIVDYGFINGYLRPVLTMLDISTNIYGQNRNNPIAQTLVPSLMLANPSLGNSIAKKFGGSFSKYSLNLGQMSLKIKGGLSASPTLPWNNLASEFEKNFRDSDSFNRIVHGEYRPYYRGFAISRAESIMFYGGLTNKKDYLILKGGRLFNGGFCVTCGIRKEDLDAATLAVKMSVSPSSRGTQSATQAATPNMCDFTICMQEKTKDLGENVMQKQWEAAANAMSACQTISSAMPSPASTMACAAAAAVTASVDVPAKLAGALIDCGIENLKKECDDKQQKVIKENLKTSNVNDTLCAAGLSKVDCNKQPDDKVRCESSDTSQSECKTNKPKQCDASGNKTDCTGVEVENVGSYCVSDAAARSYAGGFFAPAHLKDVPPSTPATDENGVPLKPPKPKNHCNGPR